jgi:hypothetical protein
LLGCVNVGSDDYDRTSDWESEEGIIADMNYASYVLTSMLDSGAMLL